MTRASVWNIDGSVARLESSALRAEVNVLNPGSGVKILADQSATPRSLTLFRIGLPHRSPSPLTGEGQPAVSLSSGGEGAALPHSAASTQSAPLDFFARETDLIATYAESRDSPFRAQIYWRLIRSQAPVAGLELVVSIQTSLLDSDPALTVETDLNAARVSRLVDAKSAQLTDLPMATSPTVIDRRSGSGCFHFQLSDGPLEYTEMIHPSDFHRSTLNRDADGPTALRLSHHLFPLRLEKGVILRSRLRGLFTPAGADRASIARAYEDFASSEPPLTA
jgi:hypothetical protein